MANEIDTLDSSDIQPFDPGMPVLAPSSPAPDTWGRTDVLTNREIYQHQQQGLTLLGAAMPAGTSKAQIDTVLGQLGGAFMHDFSSLGYPAHMVNAAISFMTANATRAPYQVQVKHRFNLHGHNDWLGHAFGNMVQELSGSPQAKQLFVTACLQWLAKACKQLSGQPVAVSQQPRMAPIDSDPTEQLSDQQYATLVKHNENVKAQTMNRLAAKYGEYSYRQVIELAQAHLESLPAADRQHFDRWTGDFPWTHMLSSFEAIDALYGMSIGINSIGDGADIAREIASFEALLKIPSERKKYMRDPQMQARLRELYARRG